MENFLECTKAQQGDGYVTVQDYYGEISMPYKTFLGMKYHNPSVLKYKNCTGFSFGLHPCDSNHYSCGILDNNIGLIISIVFLITTFLILMALRLLIIWKEFRKSGCLMKFTSKGVVALCDKEQITKYSYKKVFLYVILGLKLTTSCLLPDKNGLIYGKVGETVCLDYGNYTISPPKHRIMLTKMYNTAEWNVEDDITWGCAGGICPYAQDCIKMEEESYSFDGGNKYTKTFCRNFANACFAGRGCVFGKAVLTVRNMFEVFRIEYINRGREHFIVGDNICKFEYFVSMANYVGSHSIVKKVSSGDYWYCPNHSPIGLTNEGILGDLQIQDNKSLAFKWEDLNCADNWYEYSCFYKTSFISKIDTACIKVPNFSPLGLLSADRNGLYIESDDVISISTNCSDRLITNTNCQNLRLELWGIRSHSTGLYITAYGESDQKGIDYIGKHPCSQSILQFPCDSQLHYIPVSEESTCSNITDKTLSNNLAYFVKTHYSDPGKDDGAYSVIQYSLHNVPFIASVMSSGVLWIFIVLIIIKLIK